MHAIEIKRDDYTKYGTSSIRIKNAVCSLKNCEILDVVNTEYDYERVVVKLSEKNIIKMKELEGEVNDYLTDQGLDPIKLVYGNKIYTKKKVSTPKRQLDYIKLKGVFVNNEGKQFTQLWVM